MQTPELDTLLIANWADLDAAGARAGEIEDITFKAINRMVETWASDLGWSGVFKAPDSLWISAPAWTTSPGPRPGADAWFSLDFIDAESEHWWLTSLIGVGQGRAAFRLKQTRLGKRDWNALITAPQNVTRLPQFALDETPALALNVRLDASKFVPALHELEDFSEVLRPLAAALDQMATAEPIVSLWLGDLPKVER